MIDCPLCAGRMILDDGTEMQRWNAVNHADALAEALQAAIAGYEEFYCLLMETSTEDLTAVGDKIDELRAVLAAYDAAKGE